MTAAVRRLKRKGGTGTRLWVEDVAGLLGLVDIGVVEIHPWGATIDDIEHPDTLVFDLRETHSYKFTLTARRLERSPAFGEVNPCPVLQLCDPPGSHAC